MRHVPRYQQRLDYIPLHKHPVWVDDESFTIHYHVRHAALPRPGTLRQLKRLVGRLSSQKLDRARPLWELWVVEGIENDRFAILAKVHHCLLDGVAGVNLMGILLNIHPQATEIRPAEQWSPRPAPTGVELFTDELGRHKDRARSLFRGLSKLTEDPVGTLDLLRDRATSVLTTVGASALPSSKTVLNPSRIGAYRRFDCLRLDLQQAKKCKDRLGGTVNDVLLATVAGGVRRFLKRQDADLAGLDFRVLVPVNVRPPGSTQTQSNRVSLLILPLPLEEEDAAARLRKVTAETMQAKRLRQSHGAELVGELSSWTASGMLSQAIRLAGRLRPYNLVVTNVPGPPMPLYLLGAELQEMYSTVPLYLNQALGLAIFSYHGSLHVGLNCCWGTVTQLHQLVRDLEQAFAELVAEADEVT